ncbi:hypothetical protein DFH28DRAFT_997790 [Melampsora americana]|nr:hypothetical protein DFH28DRAFT_997790 [Melampsora americana]
MNIYQKGRRFSMMLPSMIWLIRFIYLIFLPGILTGFWDDQGTGVFFSDIIDSEPFIETSTSRLNDFSTQDTGYPEQTDENLIHFNHHIVYEMDDFYPYYQMPDVIFEKANSLSSQESRAQTEKEIEQTNTIQESNVSPREHLSIARLGTSLQSTNQESFVEPLLFCQQPLMGEKNSEPIQVRHISPRDHSSIDWYGSKLNMIKEQRPFGPKILSKTPLRVPQKVGTKQKSCNSADAENQKKRKATDQPQENIKLKQRYRVRHDQNQQYYVHESSLKSVLRWQCRILLAKRYKISEHIGNFFKELQEQFLPIPEDISYDISKYNTALEKIRNNLVMGSLGALKVIFQKHVGLDFMDSLIFDFWGYLQRYLKDEFSILSEKPIKQSDSRPKKQNHSHIDPGRLLEYTLNLAQGAPISSKIIHQKLQDWATKTSYKDILPRVAMDYRSLVDECDIACKHKGNEMTVYNKTQDKATVSQKIMQKNKNLPNTSSSSSSILSTCHFFQVLKKEGSDLAINDEILSFFFHLHSDIDSICESEKDVGDVSNSHDEGTEVLSKHMVHHAIYLAQHELTPAFMGVLRLLHPIQGDDLTWHSVSHSGWTFLKNYFSTWIRYFSETDHPILLVPPGRVRLDEEWSDLTGTLNYCRIPRKVNMVSQSLIWYLVDVWYDEIYFPESNGKEFPNFTVLPPHRDYIEQMCRKMIGRIKI